MNLTAADLTLHQQLGIDTELLARAQVYRVDTIDARTLLSVTGAAGDYSGICYPYVHPITGRRRTLRIRLDVPSDGKKYRAPYGDVRGLYFPPGADALLTDTSVPALFVEAEKAALALTAAAARAGRRVLVVALGGCWNFRGASARP